MSTRQPELVADRDLSQAWVKLLSLIIQRNEKELSPVILSIGEFSDGKLNEDSRVRELLDATLTKRGICSSAISASTIFPYRHWVRLGYPPRHQLYSWYLNRFLPRIKARDPRNRNGTYFERMIAFTGVKGTIGHQEIVAKNQLEHVIGEWLRKRDRPRRPRQSALQVACLDPAKDHTGQSVRGFPCLQQVSFAYDDDDGLAVTAYYPTQYIFDRAYGNYLGLCHLGEFMAREMDLRLVRLNCYIGRPLIGSMSKTDARGFLAMLEEERRGCGAR